MSVRIVTSDGVVTIREAHPSLTLGCQVPPKPGCRRAYLCETKPMVVVGGFDKATGPDRRVCSVPARAYHAAQPPSAGIAAEGGGAPCVTMNADDCVKKSQSAAVGAVPTVPARAQGKRLTASLRTGGRLRQTKPTAGGRIGANSFGERRLHEERPS